MRIVGRHAIGLGLLFWLITAAIWWGDAQNTSVTIARPLPVPSSSNNPYWAGYVVTGGHAYTDVQATWTVPAASCSPRAPNASAYLWIGEGGYVRGLASHLIQAGTGSDCLSGFPRYHAFYEWYPGLYATDFPITLRPGDTVTTQIEEREPDYWVLTLQDRTSGARTTTATFYQADTTSADFIVERPTLCNVSDCNQLALARFGAVTFHNLWLRDHAERYRPSRKDAIPIALVDPATNRVLAVPAEAPAATGSLSVLYRRQW